MFVRQNVRSTKCLLAKCPFGKMSFGKVSFGKMSGYQLLKHITLNIGIVKSSLFIICMDKNMLMKFHLHEVNFMLYAFCMTKCAVLNFS